jgi:molybdopterin-dependent oxidoreductase alpha subunit
MERFAAMYGTATSAVFVWSMGVTQHVNGTDNVRAIVNLALARGNIGRPGAGLMPIRGHSGVQGGAEMGAYATAFPDGAAITAESAAALSVHWGFEVPDTPGLAVTPLIDAAARGEVDVLWSSGGNFLETLPDPAGVLNALARVGLRVHVDIVASTQMLADGDEVLVLPAMTRYEQPGGGTETTTERRIVFSPEIPGPRPAEARAEWDIYLELARRVDPGRADVLGCEDSQRIREEIARVIPSYAGIELLRETGDQVQWGGERLCEGGVFPTSDGRATLAVIEPHDARLPAGHLHLTTRRGKQFNSMVWKSTDPLTGGRRDALLMAPADIAARGLAEGRSVTVRSEVGTVTARVHSADLLPGNVQMFFPEANALLDATRRDAEGLVPDYGAVVEILDD